jgi:hypothetical protein
MAGTNGAGQQVERLGKLLFELAQPRQARPHQEERRREQPDRGRDCRDERLPHRHCGDQRQDGGGADADERDRTRRRAYPRLFDQTRRPRADQHSVEHRHRAGGSRLDDRRLRRAVDGADPERDLAQPLVETAARQPPRQHHHRGVSAENRPGHQYEREDRQTHQRTSVTPSNMSVDRWMPDVFSRSQTFGLTPVARNRPTTLPSCVMPIFSKTKISCIVITSPSMPVISEMLVTFLEPSARRDC